MTQSTTDPAGGLVEVPGWYPTGRPTIEGGWDGAAWTGQALTNPGLAEQVVEVRFSTWCRQRWVRWMVLGQFLVVASALLASWTNTEAVAFSSVLGFTVFVAGATMLVLGHVDGSHPNRLAKLTAVGVCSGVLALVVAFALELGADRCFGWRAPLWLAGPIEEFAKLALPVALLALRRPNFRDPRVGVFVATVSASTFGALEGVLYVVHRSHLLTLQMALIRPESELLHPFATAYAAAIIWLVAWRRGKVATMVGFQAWALVALLHSAHDSLVTLAPKEPVLTPPHSIGEVWRVVLGGSIFQGLWLWAFWAVLRNGARELVPPTRSTTTTNRWRPKLKGWGVRPAGTGDPHPAKLLPPPPPPPPTSPIPESSGSAAPPWPVPGTSAASAPVRYAPPGGAPRMGATDPGAVPPPPRPPAPPSPGGPGGA